MKLPKQLKVVSHTRRKYLISVTKGCVRGESIYRYLYSCLQFIKGSYKPNEKWEQLNGSANDV
jgi:hypothetical protein